VTDAPAIYAWVELEPDGKQGIIAAIVPGLERFGPVLLHHRTRALAERFADLAARHAEASGRPVRFVEYRQTQIISGVG
jgi:hypothetical protein